MRNIFKKLNISFLPKNKFLKALFIALFLIIGSSYAYKYWMINNSKSRCAWILIFKEWNYAPKCHEMIMKYKNPGDMYIFFKIYETYLTPRQGMTEMTKASYYSYLYFANKYRNNEYLEELKKFEESMTTEEKINACNVMITNYAKLTDTAIAIEPDYKKAFEYRVKRANLGDLETQEHLAMELALGKFSNGLYVFDPNYIEAYKWFYISYHNGNERALKGIKKMQTLMSKSDIAKAESLAKTWIKAYKEGKIEVKLYE